MGERIVPGQEAITMLANYLQRFVCPIYGSTNGVPAVIGSGVLLGIDDQVLLVSAAHVAEQTDPPPAMFGSGGVLRPLPERLFVSPLAPGTSRDNDPIDLCFWVQPRSTILTGVCLEASSVDLRSDAPRPGRFMMIGYPESKNRNAYSATLTQVAVIPWALMTEELPESEYVLQKLNSVDNLFVDFHKKKIWRAGVGWVTASDPYGVSGGAVFRLTENREPLVAGIATTWKPRASEPGIFATRPAVLDDMLRTHLPRLSDALRAGGVTSAT